MRWIPELLRRSRGCADVHYDGVALISFDSLEALAAAAGSPAGEEAGAELLEDERRFIDLEGSVIWLTDTEVFIG